MTQLIADSGSTKIDWRLIDAGKVVKSFQTTGVNPYFHSSEEIMARFQQELSGEVMDTLINQIHFYGAGCSSQFRCQRVEIALRSFFPKAEIVVNHDLLAAARALFGKEEGITIILGTGSNSCYYNGTGIAEQRGGMGFILSDEGSGNHMGRKLIQHYLYDEMPDDLLKKFTAKFRLEKDDIIDAIYRKPGAARFLASFATFLSENIENTFCYKIAYESISEFFNRHIIKYKKAKSVPLSCLGSIGYYFSDIVKEVAKAHDIELKEIIKEPIEKLVAFHQTKEQNGQIDHRFEQVTDKDRAEE